MLISYKKVPMFTFFEAVEHFNKIDIELPVPTGSYIPQYISTRLRKIEELLPNWDGYGASVISPNVLNNSQIFLVQIPQKYLIEEYLDADNIVPASHGTINFDWINSFGDLLSVEIGATKLAYFAKFSDGKVELVEACPLPEIMPKVRKIFSKMYSK